MVGRGYIPAKDEVVDGRKLTSRYHVQVIDKGCRPTLAYLAGMTYINPSQSIFLRVCLLHS